MLQSITKHAKGQSHCESDGGGRSQSNQTAGSLRARRRRVRSNPSPMPDTVQKDSGPCGSLLRRCTPRNDLIPVVDSSGHASAGSVPCHALTNCLKSVLRLCGYAVILFCNCAIHYMLTTCKTFMTCMTCKTFITSSTTLPFMPSCLHAFTPFKITHPQPLHHKSPLHSGSFAKMIHRIIFLRSAPREGSLESFLPQEGSRESVSMSLSP